MKADLDHLMAARDLQAIFIPCTEHTNPVLHYLTGVHASRGIAIKQRGRPVLLVINPMEMDDALKAGIETYSIYDLGWNDLRKEAAGVNERAEAGLWRNCIRRFGIPSGKIGVYGAGDLNTYLEFPRRMAALLPDYTFVGEVGTTLFDEAYITKDSSELAQIKQAAAATNAVWAETWDFIAGHRAEKETVVNADGTPLTIGAVKRFVRRALLDRDLEDTGMIFAQGRDGGIPHSRGDDTASLKVGQAIVFDLFPRQPGGYYHDSTRTWCIGYAPPEVQAAYDDVLEAFTVAVSAYAEPGQPVHTMQDAVLDYLESRGHATIRSKPGTQEGLVHDLGHGFGLNIHERPLISHLQKRDQFQVGNVLTIEPGVYYPERGFGVRLEDAFYIDDNGALVALTDFHKQLVIPLRE